MSRSITIAGVERADLTRLESFSFQESAYRGEVGQGGFDVESDAGAVTVSAWKNVIADDSDGGTFYWGQTIDRGVGRGSFTDDSSAQWDVQVVDMNTIMDDILLRGSEWNRPEETDVERMQALVTFLNDEGYNIDDTYLLTTSPEDMDEQDYRKQGVYPRSVADECAENSGKNWYLFYNPALDQLAIWYGRETSSLRESAYSISSVLDDIDDYGVTWAAEWPDESGLQRDPSRVYSAVQVVYGTTNPVAVYVDRPATEAAFKRREAVLFDASVKTETKATKLANHYLDFAETEDDTITVRVTVPTTHVNAFLVGERIACRFPHLGYDTPTFMRCRQKTVEPAGGEAKAPHRYHVTLVLKPSIKTTRFGGRPANDVPGQGDNDDGGTATPPEPAELDYGSDLTIVHRRVDRRTSSVTGWVETDGYVASPPGNPRIMTQVYHSLAYAAVGCPLVGMAPGGFEGWLDEEAWFDFTAPADDPDFLGIVLTVDCTACFDVGTVAPVDHGWNIAIVDHFAVDGRTDEGRIIGGGASADGVHTFYVPRSHVQWGGDNSLALRTAWKCSRNAFFCNDGTATWTYDDGRGDSAVIEDFDVNTVRTVFFASGTTGMATDVAGYGDVDGTNVTFTLIGWDGTGSPSFSINGLDQPTADVTFDTGAKTATLAAPPPAGAIVLWTYPVDVP